MIRVRPRLVYTSGRIASIIGISTSATFRIRNRIHTRHHGIENTLLKSKWAYNLDKIVNALSTEIIAVSKCTSEILRDEGVPHSKIYVIHNGIDVEECSRIRSQRNQLFKPGDMVNPLLLGVIARLTDWKGVQFTAEAFCILRKKYPQLQIRIIGAKADAFERISKILSTEPYESYEFLSQVPNGIESYQDFSVFIHAPLELNSETFGLVYLESLAAGVPSVFTKSGILN
jgi:glycosyltransferase involved in cell wall biosynthesis